MSYCRTSDGDVYMFPSVSADKKKHIIVCCNCLLQPLCNPPYHDIRDNVELANERAAIKHLQDHRDAGHQVPQTAFDRLQQEIDEKQKEWRTRQGQTKRRRSRATKRENNDTN